MKDFAKRIAALSPEQRELLKEKLKQEGMDLDRDFKAVEVGQFPPIEPVEKKEYYPLSSVQKRLFLLDQLEGTGTAYNVSLYRMVEGDLPLVRSEEIFAGLIERHGSFRTSFRSVGRQTVQRVHGEVDFKLEYYEFDSILSVDDYHRSPEIKGVLGNFIRPFDLAKAPLLRVGLIKLGGGGSILMVDMHHIISDQASRRILWNDFTRLHQGQVLPTLKIQYADFTEWCNSTEVRQVLAHQQSYWLEELAADIPVINLPTDYVRPERKNFKGDSLNIRLDPETTGMLKTLARQESTTLFVVMLSIYFIFLSKLSRQRDVLVGTPTIGRRHVGLDCIIGMFVNTIVLRGRVEEAQTFRDFLRQVKTRTLQSFENQDYQFEDLVHKLIKKRDPGRNPFFDVFFTFTYPEVEQVAEDISLDHDEAVSEIMDSLAAAKFSMFDMFLFGAEIGETLILGITYAASLFKRETVERFVQYFKEIVLSVVANGEITLGEIKISHHLGTAKAEVFGSEDREFEF